MIIGALNAQYKSTRVDYRMEEGRKSSMRIGWKGVILFVILIASARTATHSDSPSKSAPESKVSNRGDENEVYSSVDFRKEGDTNIFTITPSDGERVFVDEIPLSNIGHVFKEIFDKAKKEQEEENIVLNEEQSGTAGEEPIGANNDRPYQPKIAIEGNESRKDYRAQKEGNKKPEGVNEKKIENQVQKNEPVALVKSTEDKLKQKDKPQSTQIIHPEKKKSNKTQKTAVEGEIKSKPVTKSAEEKKTGIPEVSKGSKPVEKPENLVEMAEEAKESEPVEMAEEAVETPKVLETVEMAEEAEEPVKLEESKPIETPLKESEKPTPADTPKVSETKTKSDAEPAKEKPEKEKSSSIPATTQASNMLEKENLTEPETKEKDSDKKSSASSSTVTPSAPPESAILSVNSPTGAEEQENKETLEEVERKVKEEEENLENLEKGSTFKETDQIENKEPKKGDSSSSGEYVTMSDGPDYTYTDNAEIKSEKPKEEPKKEETSIPVINNTIGSSSSSNSSNSNTHKGKDGSVTKTDTHRRTENPEETNRNLFRGRVRDREITRTANPPVKKKEAPGLNLNNDLSCTTYSDIHILHLNTKEEEKMMKDIELPEKDVPEENKEIVNFLMKHNTHIFVDPTKPITGKLFNSCVVRMVCLTIHLDRYDAKDFLSYFNWDIFRNLKGFEIVGTGAGESLSEKDKRSIEEILSVISSIFSSPYRKESLNVLIFSHMRVPDIIKSISSMEGIDLAFNDAYFSSSAGITLDEYVSHVSENAKNITFSRFSVDLPAASEKASSTPQNTAERVTVENCSEETLKILLMHNFFRSARTHILKNNDLTSLKYYAETPFLSVKILVLIKETKFTDLTAYDVTRIPSVNSIAIFLTGSKLTVDAAVLCSTDMSIKEFATDLGSSLTVNGKIDPQIDRIILKEYKTCNDRADINCTLKTNFTHSSLTRIAGNYQSASPFTDLLPEPRT